MGKVELIDEHVSLKQCERAIEALHSYETKRQQKLQEEELIPGKEPQIWLNVTVKTIPPGHRVKPVKVPVVHPLVDPRTSSICLITKDPQREYKDLLEASNIKFISRVVGIEKLKGKFKPYEARRALLKENGMFLADERVIPLLPKLLGKKWFDAKKQPIPVCLTRKDLKGELERSISSTYMNQNQGTCTSIKIANLSHKPSQVLANLQKALPTIVANIKNGWENIQALHIKTNSSVSLPIWTCSLDASAEGRWHNLEAGDASEGEEEAAPVVEEVVAKKATSAGKGGRKRESTSDGESDEAPRKRAKQVKEAPSTSKASKVESTPAPPAKAVATASTKTKGKAKAKPEAPATVKEAEPTPAPVPAAKKEQKKKIAEPKTKVATKAASSPAAPPAKKEKPATPTPVTTEEIKSKREGKSFEKKKDKVIKQKAGKSAKRSLLGKKAAQD